MRLAAKMTTGNLKAQAQEFDDHLLKNYISGGFIVMKMAAEKY